MTDDSAWAFSESFRHRIGFGKYTRWAVDCTEVEFGQIVQCFEPLYRLIASYRNERSRSLEVTVREQDAEPTQVWRLNRALAAFELRKRSAFDIGLVDWPNREEFPREMGRNGATAWIASASNIQISEILSGMANLRRRMQMARFRNPMMPLFDGTAALELQFREAIETIRLCGNSHGLRQNLRF